MKRYIKTSLEEYFARNEYKPEDGWTEEDIELHKSIDWEGRNYREYPVPEDSFTGEAVLYSMNAKPQYKEVKFIKYIRPNAIYPPYYAPEDAGNVFEKGSYPMYDGRKHGSYDVHDRYETQEVYDLLSH